MQDTQEYSLLLAVFRVLATPQTSPYRLKGAASENFNTLLVQPVGARALPAPSAEPLGPHPSGHWGDFEKHARSVVRER